MIASTALHFLEAGKNHGSRRHMPSRHKEAGVTHVSRTNAGQPPH